MELGVINIVLSKNSYSYSPGEVLEGRLEIDLPIPKKIKSIYLKLNGTGGVRFKNLMVISNTGKTQNVLSYADEKYVQYKHHCLRNSGNTGTLAAGKHTYPFSYHLPYDLPSTFQHEYGTIRYFLKAVLEHTKGFKQRAFKDFYVNSYLDLNLYPKLQEFHITSLVKKSTFLWIDNVKVKINVRVSKTGYTTGETIPICTEVINTSDRSILDVVFSLQKSIQFNAHAPKKDTKIVTSTLAKTHLGSQPAKRAQTYNHELVIPEFPHETLDGSKIINVKYNLQVAAVCGTNQEIVERIPLSFGVWQRNN